MPVLRYLAECIAERDGAVKFHLEEKRVYIEIWSDPYVSQRLEQAGY